MERLTELLSAIKPYVLGWIGTIGGGTGPFAPSPHDLNSAHHSGSIADTQAPQFLLSNGGRTLTGNLAVSSGVTIDGVDISAFNGEAFLTLGNTAGLPNERAIAAGNGLTGADGGAGSSYTLNVGAGSGITVNADDVALTTPGTLTVSSTNNASGSHTHAITSSSNPGAAASLLATNASGDVTLQHLNLAASSNQVVLQSGGVTGTLTWTPASSNKTITLPNLTGTAALGAGTLTVSSANSVTVADHTHAITSSSNPGAAASLLASDASGALQLTSLTLSTALTTPRVTATANLTIDPTGDVIFDPAGNDILPNVNYDLNIGALDKKYLTLHVAELWVETLVAQDTIATIGGRVIVAPTTTLIADLATGGTTIDVKHNQMRSGDRALMQANGKIEWMAITSGPTTISGGYRYSVTRNLDGSGANQWYAGDAVVNTGQAGNGFIDLYSLSAVLAPSVDYVFNYNQTGAAFSANYAGYSTFTLFGDGANTEVNDAVYFGATGTTWANLYYNLGTAAVYTATLVWEYWNGSAWTTFSPTTTDFKSTGLQSTTWTAGNLTGWAANTVNSISAYWVRVRISAFTSWATQPVQSGYRIYRNRRQVGPTIAGQVRNSGTFDDVSEHWAIGNLNGLYGYTADVFGVAVGKYSASTSWLAADATNGIRIMRGSTQLAQWDVSGNILIGQAAVSQSNVYISSGAISIRNNTTERIGLTAAGVLTIKDSGGNAVFTFDASAGAEFTKALTLGTNGGIYQGSGTFASPTTGLKVWNDSGIGRIGGYNSGLVQWYADTTGKLLAGAGSIELSQYGLLETQYGPAISLYNGAGAMIGLLESRQYDTSPTPIKSAIRLSVFRGDSGEKISNRGFDGGSTTGWTLADGQATTWTAVTSGGRLSPGNLSAQSTSDSISGPATAKTDYIAIAAGEVASASVWLKPEQVAGQCVMIAGISIEWYTSGNAFISAIETRATVSILQWQQTRVSGTAPATAAKFKVVLWADNVLYSVGKVRFDDVSAMVYASQYFHELTDNGYLETNAHVRTTGALYSTLDGSSGGVFIGSDGQWYRSAANLLRTPDSVTIDGGVNVGSASGAAANQLFIGSASSNSSAASGGNITIDIGSGALTEIMSFKSSDVAHGMTARTDTNTFGFIAMGIAASGGLRIEGYTEDKSGLMLFAKYTNGDTTRAYSSRAGVQVDIQKKNGTSSGTAGTNEDLFAISTYGATKLIVDAEGDLFLDSTYNQNVWDDYDDVALLEAYRVMSGAQITGSQLFGEAVQRGLEVLARTGVATLNPDGHHFVSIKGLHALEIDALRQLARRVERLESERNGS